jgi:hypothetical protein
MRALNPQGDYTRIPVVVVAGETVIFSQEKMSLMTDGSTCVWSGKSSCVLTETQYEIPKTYVGSFADKAGEIKLTVCAEHSSELDAFVEFYKRYGAIFDKSFVTLFVGILGGVGFDLIFTHSIGVTSVFLVLIGILFTSLPFSTPQTVAVFGLRRSIWIARTGGVILVLLGTITFIWI